MPSFRFGQGASPYLIPPDPVKALGFLIGMFQVIHEEMGHIRTGCPSHPKLLVILLACFPIHGICVGQIPVIQIGCRVILQVANHSTPFQDQGLQPVFAQFLSGPPTGNTGSDNNCIEHFGRIDLHEVYYLRVFSIFITLPYLWGGSFRTFKYRTF